MKRRLYIDGNAVYGIDEECMRRKQEQKEQETENYMLLLMYASYKNSVKKT